MSGFSRRGEGVDTLTRMAFRIKDLPSPGDKVNIRTCAAKLEHLGHRGYEVYNASRQADRRRRERVDGTDLSTRRPTALPEELAAVYPVNTIPLASPSRPGTILTVASEG